MTERTVAAEVERRQRARLDRATLKPTATGETVVTPSPWRHVPLAELFVQLGNPVRERSGRIESGHEPFHSSKSGGCTLINPATGYWWCRSCGGRGDAVGFVMRLRGWKYAQAAAWLTERCGPPRVDGVDGTDSPAALQSGRARAHRRARRVEVEL